MEGKSLKLFENLTKIFETRIKLDHLKHDETPEDVLINYEKYCKKIDNIYNEEFEKEVKPLIAVETTIDKEEERLAFIRARISITARVAYSELCMPFHHAHPPSGHWSAFNRVLALLTRILMVSWSKNFNRFLLIEASDFALSIHGVSLSSMSCISSFFSSSLRKGFGDVSSPLHCLSVCIIIGEAFIMLPPTIFVYRATTCDMALSFGRAV